MMNVKVRDTRGNDLVAGFFIIPGLLVGGFGVRILSRFLGGRES